MTYELRTFAGSAADFHARTIGDDPAQEVWAFDVTTPALVLGSAQREADVVDLAACLASSVEVVHRRSGGGAVLLVPGEVVWFDVVVPAADLHAAGVGDDVAASMTWFGKGAAAALADLGVSADVHTGGMVACSAWCPLVCFAGIGPGEVLTDGVKLLGISQRRTRAGARFQCAAHTRWSPEALTPLLTAHPPAAEMPPVATVASAVAGALPAAVAAVLGSGRAR